LRAREATPAFGMPRIHAWVLQRQHYWDNELSRLRQTFARRCAQSFPSPRMNKLLHSRHLGAGVLAALIALTALSTGPAWPAAGCSTTIPTSSTTPACSPTHASVSTLVNAALSSPASEFKRPLASLSFAANFPRLGLESPTAGS